MVAITSRVSAESSGRRLARKRLAAIASSAATMLVLEAFFGGGYVSLVKGYIIAMMLDAGFSMRIISLVMLLVYLGVLIGCQLAYRGATRLESRVRSSLLALHAGERIFYVLLPLALFIGGVYLFTIAYALGEAMDVLVGALLTYYILVLFDERGVRRVVGWRTSAGLIATIIAHAAAASILYAYPMPLRYFMVYGVAGLFAVASWLCIYMAPLAGKPVAARESNGGVEEEAKAATVFIVLALGSLAGFLYGLGWQSYLLRVLRAPSYLVAVASLLSTAFIAVVAPLTAKASFNVYRALILAMPLAPLLTLAARSSIICIALVPMFSLSSTVVGFAAVSLYKRISGLNMVKLSLKLSSAMALGNFLAMSITYFLSLNPVGVLVASAIAAIATGVVSLVAIEELAVSPSERVRARARLLYYASLATYRGVIDVSETYVKTAARLLLLVLLFSLLALVYRAAMILAGLGAPH